MSGAGKEMRRLDMNKLHSVLGFGLFDILGQVFSGS